MCSGALSIKLGQVHHQHPHAHIYDEKVTGLQLFLLSVLAEKQHLLGTAAPFELRGTFHSPRSVNECIVKLSHSSVFSQASAVMVRKSSRYFTKFQSFCVKLGLIQPTQTTEASY